MEANIFYAEPPAQLGVLHYSSIWRQSNSNQEMEVKVYDTGIVSGQRYIGFCFDIRFSIQNCTITFITQECPICFELPKGDQQTWRSMLRRHLNQTNFHQEFKPVKKIGKGNFASVYLVERIKDGKQFAVKAFSKESSFSQQNGKECLVKEVQIMRKLNSPYNLKLEGVYQTENSLYLVFQLLSGGQLFDKIKNKEKLKHKQVQTIIRNILEGLKELHALGIMHRDLKPENILLRSEDSVECVIADFGLAEYSKAQEYLFVRCGTPGYVAPEVINIKDMTTKYQPACDIFSLGLIFHLLLIGKSIFAGKTYKEVLNENRLCNFKFYRPEYSKLDKRAKDLLMKMLEIDPKMRITAQQALKHPYFDLQQAEQQKNEELEMSESVARIDVGQSPILTTANEQRKLDKNLERDSCLKFKMGKQNVMTGKVETAGTMDSGKMSGFGINLLKNLKASKFTKPVESKEN